MNIVYGSWRVLFCLYMTIGIWLSNNTDNSRSALYHVHHLSESCHVTVASLRVMRRVCSQISSFSGKLAPFKKNHLILKTSFIKLELRRNMLQKSIGNLSWICERDWTLFISTNIGHVVENIGYSVLTNVVVACSWELSKQFWWQCLLKIHKMMFTVLSCHSLISSVMVSWRLLSFRAKVHQTSLLRNGGIIILINCWLVSSYCLLG